MPSSSNHMARLREELKLIKGKRSYQAMADECGLEPSHLWRIIKGERQPYGTTIERLLSAYPQLSRVFLPPDIPRGTPELPEPQAHGESL